MYLSRVSVEQELGGADLLRGSLPLFAAFKGSARKSGSPAHSSSKALPLSPLDGGLRASSEAFNTPDYTFTTTRRALHMTSPALGGQLLDESSMPAAVASAFASAGMARPKSASVNAAAWKAYGSPSARGQHRPAPQPDSMHARPKLCFLDSMPGRPTSVLTLGGGYQLPRPHSAPTQPILCTPMKPKPIRRGAQDLTGAMMDTSPKLITPLESLAGHQGRTDYRFSETRPTDPKALQVFQDMQRRHGGGSGSDRPTTSPREHRPAAAAAAAASPRAERFASSSLRSVHSAGAGFRPAVVSGFSAPEAEVALPAPSDALFRFSRKGYTSLCRMQDRLKLAGCPTPRPFSAPVHTMAAAAAAPWAQDHAPPAYSPDHGDDEDEEPPGFNAQPMPTVAEEGRLAAALAEASAFELSGSSSAGAEHAQEPDGAAAGRRGAYPSAAPFEGDAEPAEAGHLNGLAVIPQPQAGCQAVLEERQQQQQQQLLELPEDEDSGFVREDGDGDDDCAEAGLADEVEQVIERMSRLGQQRSGTAVGQQGEQEPLPQQQQQQQEAQEEEQAHQGDGGLAVEVEVAAPGLVSRGSGNALDALYGGRGDAATDLEGEGRREMMQMLMHEGDAAAAAGDGDDGGGGADIQEDAGDELFELPGPAANSAARPSSGLRPASARPTSGRPTSGRPTSARPTSGRPTSGSRAAGGGGGALAGGPGPLAAAGSLGMNVILEHDQPQEEAL